MFQKLWCFFVDCSKIPMCISCAQRIPCFLLVTLKFLNCCRSFIQNTASPAAALWEVPCHFYTLCYLEMKRLGWCSWWMRILTIVDECWLINTMNVFYQFLKIDLNHQHMGTYGWFMMLLFFLECNGTLGMRQDFVDDELFVVSDMLVSNPWGVPHFIIHFNRIFHYKPSILGYPYLRKPPYPLVNW